MCPALHVMFISRLSFQKCTLFSFSLPWCNINCSIQAVLTKLLRALMVPEVVTVVRIVLYAELVLFANHCHRIGCGRILPLAQIWSKEIRRGSPSACSIPFH